LFQSYLSLTENQIVLKLTLQIKGREIIAIFDIYISHNTIYLNSRIVELI
jgi:hypothetical protein